MVALSNAGIGATTPPSQQQLQPQSQSETMPATATSGTTGTPVMLLMFIEAAGMTVITQPPLLSLHW
jgi:hypothetical protein